MKKSNPPNIPTHNNIYKATIIGNRAIAMDCLYIEQVLIVTKTWKTDHERRGNIWHGGS